MMILLATLALRASAKPDPMVSADLTNLVQAESQLMHAGLARRGFYPGSYRAPGDFAGRILRGMNAQRLDLRGFNFRGADLRACDFYGADLRGADLSDADLSDGVLVGARLEGARMNKRSKLPISENEAIKRGVVLWPGE